MTRVALEASAQQASQNQELEQLNREVAQGTRQLIESRGEADQLLLSQQQGLQTERNQLDAERRVIATERNRESLLAPALVTVGSLLVCGLPLVLCWYLLHRLGTDAADAQVTQLLVEQLTAQSESELLPVAQPITLLRASGSDRGELPATEPDFALVARARPAPPRFDILHSIPRALRAGAVAPVTTKGPNQMTQLELNREVAGRTGETRGTIRRRGFSLLEISCPPPLVVDWEELESQRHAVLPDRQRSQPAMA